MIQVLRLAATLGILLVLGGCAGSQPPNYYALHSIQNVEPQVRTVSTDQDLSIGVGPVKIPEYLERPQMATRSTPSTLQFAEFDKWAESLEKNLARVLAENLSILIPSDQISVFPWQKCMMVRYQITVDVVHLEKMPDGKILLDARWNILGNEGEKLLLMKRSRVVMPVETAGFEGIASAQSRAVEALSREIATAVRSLPSEPT